MRPLYQRWHSLIIDYNKIIMSTQNNLIIVIGSAKQLGAQVYWGKYVFRFHPHIPDQSRSVLSSIPLDIAASLWWMELSMNMAMRSVKGLWELVGCFYCTSYLEINAWSLQVVIKNTLWQAFHFKDCLCIRGHVFILSLLCCCWEGGVPCIFRPGKGLEAGIMPCCQGLNWYKNSPLNSYIHH